MYQIGITNDPDRSLNQLQKLLWELLEVRGPMYGLIARKWETDTLCCIRKSGAKFGPKEVAGQFDGYSEAWLQMNFEVRWFVRLMNATRDSEV